MRILVVEDSPTQALEIVMLLEQAGMDVTLAADGLEALTILRGADFDSVLSDIEMPGMTGYDLCREIRRLPAGEQTSVILLTRLTRPADILRGLECQADNYVTKPFLPDYLIERIHGAVANRHTRAVRDVNVGLQISLQGETYSIGPNLEKTLDFLLTSVDECLRMKEREQAREMEESRERVEAETERFFTVSLDMLAIVGFDGYLKRLNAAWQTTLGLSSETLTGRPFIEFVHAEDREATCRYLQEGGSSCESRWICSDGSYRRLLWSCTSAPNQFRYLVARDITQRAHEEERARTHARLQTAMASLGQQALVETDLSVLLELAIRLSCETLEVHYCTAAEARTDGSLASIHSYPRPAVPPECRLLALYTLQRGQPLVIEDLPQDKRFSHAIGVVVSSVSVLIPGREGAYGVLGVHSVTPRVFLPEEVRFLQATATILASAISRTRVEQDLRHSEERNRLLLDSTAEAIYGVDLNGICTFCNPAALHLLGYQRADQFLGQNMHRLIHHSRADGTPYRESECPIERGGAAHVDDEVLWRADGTSFHAEYWSYPILRKNVRVGGVVTFLDITARRLLEHQFRHMQKMEAVGRLAGGIAHDFNNLLTVVTGYCDLLNATEVGMTRDGREMVDEINQAAKRATSLTGQLLSFSRRQVAHPRIVNLNSVVTDMQKLLRRLIGEDIEVVISLAPGVVNIKADPTQLEQVIANLAVNARDAMPTGGRITLETSEIVVVDAASEKPTEAPPGCYRVITIRDTGAGMDAETMKRMFEPFFTTKGEGKGTGLGLSTVHDIVQQLGGHITVSSVPGSGTAFSIFFQPTEEPAEALPSAGWRPPPVTGGTETVLIVDDDRELRKLASTVLERNGYQTIAAADGRTALDICLSHGGPIHLMVSDLMMPGLNGRELADKVTQLRPKTRILITSGYDRADLRADFSLAQSHFLPKPYTPDGLLTAVRSVLDGVEQPAHSDVA